MSGTTSDLKRIHVPSFSKAPDIAREHALKHVRAPVIPVRT